MEFWRKSILVDFQIFTQLLRAYIADQDDRPVFAISTRKYPKTSIGKWRILSFQGEWRKSSGVTRSNKRSEEILRKSGVEKLRNLGYVQKEAIFGLTRDFQDGCALRQPEHVVSKFFSKGELRLIDGIWNEIFIPKAKSML